MQPAFKTRLGKIVLQDSLEYIRDQVKDDSLDLIITSPPFGLVRKKDYGNVDADKYVQWFWPFAREFYRILNLAVLLSSILEVRGFPANLHAVSTISNF